MIELRRTQVFADWLSGLRDRRGAARIAARLDRIAFTGLLGDVKRFDGMIEIRCDFGPGYRVYAIERGDTLIILLCGGDKQSQRRDLAQARLLARAI